jgi:uncharacterized protein YsxB (DUF464 family)
MINITFKPKTLELEIKGHAKQDVKGKDIVCAAISTLFYTLAQAICDSERMLTKKPVIKEKDGEGKISCKPKKEFEGNIARTYWTILVGFELVANEYKDYIKFDIV